MAEPLTAPAAKPPARRRDRLVELGLEVASLSMLAFIATGLVIWSGRREISRELAESWLRDHGIEAAVELEDLDSTGFTGRVRLGPRDAPVFAADRLEVAYDLTLPWNGETFGFQTRAVRLVRPRLSASLDGKGLRFGPLQPLIDQVMKAPPRPGVPGPAVLIEDGRLDLSTPGGRARITGDASLDDGRLVRFDGRLPPLRYVDSRLALESQGAQLSLRKRGERLTIEASAALDDLQAESADLSGATAGLEADLPYPDLARMAADGPFEARLRLRAQGGRVGEGRGEDLAGEFSATGRLNGRIEALAFLGRARGALRGARLSAPSLDARQAELTFDIARVAGGRDKDRLTARGAIRAELRASEVAAGTSALRALRVRASSDNLGFATGTAGPAASGPLALDADAGRLAVGALALSAARLDAKGVVKLGQDGTVLDLVGSGGGRSGLSGPDAQRLGSLVPNPAYARTLSQALRTFDLDLPAVGLDLRGGRARVTLPRAATLQAPNGVVATAAAPESLLLDLGPDGARGGLRASLSGGGLPVVRVTAPRWRAANGVTTSPVIVATEGFDLPPIRGVTGQVEGQARVDGGRFTLTLAGCAPIAAQGYDLGDNPVTDIKALLCPATAPLVATAGGGWSAALRFRDGEGVLAVAETGLRGVEGEARLGGADGFDRAGVRVDRVVAHDMAPQRRFNPVLATGRLDLAQGLWTGDFQATTPTSAPLGEIRLRHVVATGVGQADIDASRLAFAKNGLQPAELTPMAAFAREAEGPASFTGVFAWDPKGATSRGRLAADRIDFTSPIGFVATLDGTVDFDSLAPLTTVPGQTLRVVKIDSLVPLTAVESVFQLGADVLRVSKASFQAAEGRVSIEPVDVPLEAGKTISGAVVIQHLDLGQLIAASSLADRIRIEAVIDGRLPFTFGPEGLRFQDGRITAIRPGRVEISRAALSTVAASPTDSPGAPPPAPAQVNAIQDFAYQAMENLAFDELEAGVNSTPNGRLSVLFHIKGEHDPKAPEKARVGIIDLLRGRAFDKRIALPAKTPVDLTLDTSLNFDELLDAWRRTFESTATAQPRSDPVQP